MHTLYTIRVGQHLTDYCNIDVIVERVAQGGMGLVAMGPNRENDGYWIALKTIKPETLRRNPDLRERFIREGIVWRGLWPHPNILLSHGVTEIDGLPFLVLDYAGYGSLADLLKHGRLTLDTSLWIAQHIAAGLIALHTPDHDRLRPHPIVHRDLKPDNILLREISGMQYAQITDFGLVALLPQVEEASIMDDACINVTIFHTLKGNVMGTPAYMAPEQWVDMTLVGPPVDVYALGLILAQCLTNAHPLLPLNQEHSNDRWRAAHAHGTPQWLQTLVPDVPVTLEQLYLSMLAKYPEDRPTAQQVLADLNLIAERLSLPTYSPRETVGHTFENEIIYWYGWATAYSRFDLYPEALARNERAFQLAPYDHAVLRGRGLIMAGMQRWNEALACYESSLQVLSPEDYISHSNGVYGQIAILHSQQGHYAAAEAAYIQALTKMPDTADTWYNRSDNERLWGLSEMKAGQRNVAHEHYQQARNYSQRSWKLNPADVNTPLLFAEIERLIAEMG